MPWNGRALNSHPMVFGVGNKALKTARTPPTEPRTPTPTPYFFCRLLPGTPGNDQTGQPMSDDAFLFLLNSKVSAVLETRTSSRRRTREPSW